ncbi:MAG: acyl-CoA dehydrogenase family protein [Anaerolineae bacterium]|nr:acyl-CoA dehydrogenase family protein [Anaerolineae bacterium]
MDFSIPPHVQDIVRRVRHFVDAEVIPVEASMRQSGEQLTDEPLHDLRQKAKAARLWAPQLPTDLGGLGLSLSEIVPVFETAGRSLLGPVALNCAAPDEGNMHLLHLYANDQQRDTYLKPLAHGDIRSAFAMTEPAPGAGSDPTMLLTRAEKDGDDWIINGHKWWTSGANGAAFLLIMARTDPDVPASKGSTIFIAPIETPGIEIVRDIPHMGGAAIGGHGEVKFHDLRLPSSAVLGQLGEGFGLTQARLGPARLTHCMRWTGIAQRALEIATRYAVEREAFGKHLAEHQSIQWMLADSQTELHMGRLLIHHAAWLLEQGERARQETSMAKVVVAETVNRVIDRAIQICGGLGISRDLPLSEWYEAARAFRIYDGASEVHRMVIARQVVKAYGTPQS